MAAEIRRILLHHVEIPFKSAFRHAKHERVKTDALIVEAQTAGGAVGFGEIQPRLYVTGETSTSVIDESAPAAAERLLGRSLGDRDAVFDFLREEIDRSGRQLATYAGLELALLDAAGQSLGFSLASAVGALAGGTHEERALPAGVVIGFDIETKALSKYCAVLRLSGKRHVKVKVGLADDLERLDMISHVLKGVALRIDANGAYPTPEVAISAIEAMKSRGVSLASVEQPLAADDLLGLRRVREATGVKVMADESLVTLDDAERLIDERAADIFNIRLGKCGGLFGSGRLMARAREAGLTCNLGTMVGETGILTRAAEVFGRLVPGLECLDGKAQNELLLEDDVLEDPRSAQSAKLDAPGLGVKVLEEKIARHRSRPPVQFA
jgi:muconate cycloisomerase